MMLLHSLFAFHSSLDTPFKPFFCSHKSHAFRQPSHTPLKSIPYLGSVNPLSKGSTQNIKIIVINKIYFASVVLFLHKKRETMDTLLHAPAISGFFNVMFNRMATTDFKNFLMGHRSTMLLLAKLRTKMMIIDKVLDHAEEKQMSVPSVKSWLDEVKNALYDTEDLVDQIEVLQRMEQARTPGRKLIQEQVDSKIEEIYQRLEGLEPEIDVLGLKIGQAREAAKQRELSSTSDHLPDGYEISGRGSEGDEIIEFLQQCGATEDGSRAGLSNGVVEKENSVGENKFRIVALTGLPGSGKTALAQTIYNDRRLDDLFSLKVWVFVSEALEDVSQITKTILSSIPSSPSGPECDDDDGHFTGSHEDLNSLQVSLRRRLLKSGKKFLVVLDDVSETSTVNWDDLLLSLKSASGGNGTVLVTTSSNSSTFAANMRPHHSLHLHALSDDNCWLLVKKFAFKNSCHQDCEGDTALEGIARELSRKCKGLPLSARMVGCLLGSTPAKEWKDVLESEIWSRRDFLPSLLLSYNYLPSYLKRCFAYCSMFPRNFTFDRENVVRLWMAEGFVCLPQDSERYFNELVSRSFLQQWSSNKSYFVMHPLIHELARYVSGEFTCFLAEAYRPETTNGHTDDNRVLAQSFAGRTRHLSYSQNVYDAVGRFSRVLDEVEHLRTFLPTRSSEVDDSSCYVSYELLESLMHKFKGSLRVLSLSHYKIPEMPLSIGALTHLRFLNFSHTSIHNLPEPIFTLYNLQTLLVSNCPNLTQLSPSIGKLKGLFYLDLSRTKISQLPRSICALSGLNTLLLSHCPINLLPPEFSRLTSLRHLDLTRTRLREMPPEFGKLNKLKTLSNFIVGRTDGSSGVEVLHEFKHLQGSIKISQLKNVASASENSNSKKILDCPHLQELVLEWNRGAYLLPLNDTSPKQEGLKSLVIIKDNAANSPTPSLFPDTIRTLVSLRLVNCFYDDAMELIWQLPSVRYVDLTSCTSLSRSSNCIIPGSCETLRLEGLDLSALNLKPRSSTETISKLRQVFLYYCPRLSVINWPDLPALRKLEIIKCKRLGSRFPTFPLLETLVLRECDTYMAVDCFEKKISSLRSLALGDQFWHSKFILELCPGLEELIITYSLPKYLPLPGTVKSLSISHCRRLEIEGTRRYPCLQRLTVSDSCDSLTAFGFGGFPNLEYLELERCEKLTSITIPDDVSSLPRLSVLSISDCPELSAFPSEGLPAPNLATLTIAKCPKLMSLPANMCGLTSLQALSVSDCPEILSFPAGGFPTSLHSLSVRNCGKLMSGRRQWPVKQAISLRKLEIERCDNTISFPENDWLPESITDLKITAFRNLNSLNGTELSRLGSLRALQVWVCLNLQSLPKEGMPGSLCYLQIVGCPNLAESCRREEGGDWEKISHLLGVNIDGMDT